MTSEHADDGSELRRQAEERLATSQLPETASPQTDVDARRLLHELQVHQVELEMQYDELLRARAEAEAVLDRYTDLYDFAPTAYFTVDRNVAIVELNLAGARLLGDDRARLVGQPFGRFVVEDRRPAFTAWLELVWTAGSAGTGQAAPSFELGLLRDDGPSCWVQLEAAATDDQQACRLAATDITARRRSELLLAMRAEFVELSQHAALPELLQAALGRAAQATSSGVSSFHFVDEDEQHLSLPGWSTQTMRGLESDAGIWRDCLRAGQPVIRNELANPAGHELLRRQLVVPVRREGRIRAVLAVANKASDYTQDDVQALLRLLELVVDIVARKRAEEALRQSDERFRVALQSAPVTVWHQDQDLRYTWMHHASPAIVADVVGHTDADLFPPEEAALLGAIKRRVATSGVGERTEVALTVAGVTRFWDLTIEPLRDARGKVVGVTCAALDVTERKRSEETLRERLEEQVRIQTSWLTDSNLALEQRAAQLQHLASELTLAEERQRRELASVLHDDVQQLLVGALMQAEALLRQTTHEPVRLAGQRVREIITEAVAATRSLTWGLSPPVLYELGLGAALQGLAQRSFEQYGLHVVVETDPHAEPHSETVLVLLFRSAQELLLNIVKHAQVDAAEVRLSRLATDEVQTEVTDHGIGFDAAALRAVGGTGGLGLAAMRQRLEHLGGRMEVRSEPGVGTSVRLIAPLNGEPPQSSPGKA